MDQFPSNSHKARAGKERPPKRVQRVTSGEVRRRKQPLGRQFRSTFFNGDARMALEYMVTQTIIPSAKEMILDAGNAGLERLIYGDTGRNRRSPSAGGLGRVNYGGMFQRGPEPPRSRPTPELSRPSRMRHAFDEVIIDTRWEAEEVLDRLYDLISQDELATVADLYELTGIKSEHTDEKWGWTSLRGSSIGRIRGGGYVLELPEPIPLG